MNIVFIGPQGSGKGTQAKIIADQLSLPHISTGDLLRNLDGELKKEADSYMNSGKLVPDEFIIKILNQRIKRPDCKKGFILDGFPRNINQAKTLDKSIKIGKAIEISITDQEAIKRILSRISCQKCGIVFNLSTNPPKKENICDVCGNPLIRRKDDTQEALEKRLETYHKETKPIIAYYMATRIDGAQPIEKVTKDILKELK